ncbi:MAG: HEAT repeat domain-containing protein [Xanthobacteraceae bacterium]
MEVRVPRDHNKGGRLGLFGWFSGRGGQVPKRNARELMRIAKEDNGKRVDEAILALARLPHSDDILECVAGFIPKNGGLGPHTSTAIVALGIIRHPRAADILIKLVASPKSPCREAGKALGHARNNHAVPGLLNIALTSPDFECARVAVLALEKIGTPDAGAALAKFRAQPGRRVRVTGADGEYWSSTGPLGQLAKERDPPTVADADRVIVSCPNRRCRQQLRLAAGRQGKVKCPSCKTIFKAAT